MSWFTGILLLFGVILFSILNSMMGGIFEAEAIALTAHATARVSRNALSILPVDQFESQGALWAEAMEASPTPLSRLWFAIQINREARQMRKAHARAEAEAAEAAARAAAIEDAAWGDRAGQLPAPAPPEPVSIFAILLQMLSPFGRYGLRGVVVLTAMGLSGACYALTVKVAQARAELVEARAKIVKATKHNRLLELEVATRASLTRLQRANAQYLKLESQQPWQFCVDIACAETGIVKVRLTMAKSGTPVREGTPLDRIPMSGS